MLKVATTFSLAVLAVGEGATVGASVAAKGISVGTAVGVSVVGALAGMVVGCGDGLGAVVGTGASVGAATGGAAQAPNINAPAINTRLPKKLPICIVCNITLFSSFRQDDRIEQDLRDKSCSILSSCLQKTTGSN
jgi:hypothetical protein